MQNISRLKKKTESEPVFHGVVTWHKASARVTHMVVGPALASVLVTAQRSVPELGV